MIQNHKTISTRPSDRELIISRIFDAPRALLWSAWTDPAQLAQWFGPDGFSITTHHMSVKPKGQWRFIMHGPDGRDYKNRIDFIEVKEPERLVYTHSGEEEDQDVEFQTITTFESLDSNTTRLTMLSLFKTAADLKFVVENYGAEEGGKQTIGRLAEHLEKIRA